MTRQEIIKTIEMCYEVGNDCTECPLFSEDECEDKLMHIVLAFLKEQEPKPIEYIESFYPVVPIACCPKCKKSVRQFHSTSIEETHYCPWCGQAVKWE